MTHLTDEQAVALFYGDATAAEEAHRDACPSCAARFEEVRGVLATVPAPEVPEPGTGFEAEVWSRVQPGLAFEAARRKRRRILRGQAWTWAAAAAALVMAFLLGRHAPRPEAATAQALSPATRERILLVAVGDHFERSEMLLVELVNARADGRAVDISSEQERAETLVSASRLYRQSTGDSGDPGVASVLEELERVLIEVAHQPSLVSTGELEHLRRRIESRGILLKVRVIGTKVRENENSGRGVPPRDQSQSQVS